MLPVPISGVRARRWASMLGVVTIVAAACSGTAATPSPVATPEPSSSVSSASPSAGASASGSPSVCAADDINCLLFTTNYNPGPGTSGGTLVLGEWQAPKQLNPFYSTAFATVEATNPAMRGPLTVTSDGKYIADLAGKVPTLSDGITLAPDNKSFTMTLQLKPGLMWSDG